MANQLPSNGNYPPGCDGPPEGPAWADELLAAIDAAEDLSRRIDDLEAAIDVAGYAVHECDLLGLDSEVMHVAYVLGLFPRPTASRER